MLASVLAQALQMKRHMNERYGSVHRDREPEREDFEGPRVDKGR